MSAHGADLLGAGVALAVAALATPLLARAAERLGWTDDPAAAPERKLQARPVPPVGGAAILLALAAARLVAGPLAWSAAHERGAWTALGLAFLVGLADDLKRGGLGPATKLALQGLPALALGAAAQGPPLVGLAWAAAALAAQNLVNTWDNADGAAAALGLVGLLPGLDPAAGAVAGFLPWNFARRRAAQSAGAGTPRAYLGDSGSHLLGILLVLTPWAWPVLWLALLDLARLAWARSRSGSRPWIGDRRHLAHRLAAAGLAPRGVVLATLAPALPLSLAGLVWIARRAAFPAALGAGVALATLLYALLVLATVDPEVA